MKISLIMVFFLSGLVSHSQTLKDVAAIEKKYADCYCFQQHDLAIDSLLNVVYKKRISQLSTGDAIKFKHAQRQWIRKRDEAIKKYSIRVHKESSGGTADIDMIIGEYTEIQLKRVKEIIKLVQQ